jgi:hypothetical protein
MKHCAPKAVFNVETVWVVLTMRSPAAAMEGMADDQSFPMRSFPWSGVRRLLVVEKPILNRVFTKPFEHERSPLFW